VLQLGAGGSALVALGNRAVAQGPVGVSPAPRVPTHVHSLGWFIRFAPPQNVASSFYPAKLGIPVVRALGDQAKTMFFWGGEAIIWEVIPQATSLASEPDFQTASCYPIFRVHGLEELVTAYRRAGVAISAAQQTPRGREAFIVDPDGHVAGLRERPGNSRLRHDRVAAERRIRGEAFNPGCASMPAGLQETGWVVRRVADVARSASFYRDILGLPVVAEEGGHLMLDLGDNSLLELAPGGPTRKPPRDRRECPNTFILRVHERAKLVATLKARGVPLVNEHIEWPAGDLTYAADPDGYPVGLEERRHPSQIKDGSAPLPEDIEARRRWRESLAPVSCV
jgi:catechol 2,3-dioxygenase-like lactoylglutathione lyase family enzyme